MHLDYPMKKSGLFALKKSDIDDIANKVLAAYQPDVLKNPQPLDSEYFIK